MSGNNEEETEAEAELDERGMHLGDVFADDETTDEDEAERRAAAQASPTTETSPTSATSQTSETPETPGADPTTATDDPGGSGGTTGDDQGTGNADPGSETSTQASKIVRESKNLNIYVSEELYERVQRTYKELDGEYYAAHGEDLEKNRGFYTTLLRAGLESGELRERLGLE